MKKFVIIVVCAAVTLALAACGGQTANSAQSSENEQAESIGGVQIPNPFTDCKTLEEAQDLAGFNISLPAAMPEGYAMSAIRTIKDNMIEIVCTSGSDEIRIRKGIGSEDVSGDYSEYSETGTVTVGSLQVTMKGNGGKVNVASWLSGGYTFSITANPGGEGIGKDALSDMAGSVK